MRFNRPRQGRPDVAKEVWVYKGRLHGRCDGKGWWVAPTGCKGGFASYGKGWLVAHQNTETVLQVTKRVGGLPIQDTEAGLQVMEKVGLLPIRMQRRVCRLWKGLVGAHQNAETVLQVTEIS